MPDYYADSSALIKRHVNEVGSTWMRLLVESDDNVIITARISFVEVFSALNRRLREAKLSLRDYRAPASYSNVMRCARTTRCNLRRRYTPTMLCNLSALLRLCFYPLTNA